MASKLGGPRVSGAQIKHAANGEQQCPQSKQEDGGGYLFKLPGLVTLRKAGKFIEHVKIHRRSEARHSQCRGDQSVTRCVVMDPTRKSF
jgi:hypothetical protein